MSISPLEVFVDANSTQIKNLISKISPDKKLAKLMKLKCTPSSGLQTLLLRDLLLSDSLHCAVPCSSAVSIHEHLMTLQNTTCRYVEMILSTRLEIVVEFLGQTDIIVQ